MSPKRHEAEAPPPGKSLYLRVTKNLFAMKYSIVTYVQPVPKDGNPANWENLEYYLDHGYVMKHLSTAVGQGMITATAVLENPRKE